MDDDNEPGRPISYAANGKRIPVQNDPVSVWQRLFGASVGGGGLSTLQKGALDYARAEYEAMQSGMDATQRFTLGAHFDHVRRLGERLQGMATLACDAKGKAPAATPSYDERFDAMAGLIGAAFACDVTRVVSLSLGEMKTSAFGWDHYTDNVHKGLAHGIYDNADKHAAMTDYIAKHAGQVARLVKLLADLPDGDGKSVMDNTLIVWGSELADGWHGYWHYNPVIIGGGWHFDTGRYIYRPHETPIEVLVPASASANGWSKFSGIPHQHLLTSAAQAMGVSVEHVGLEHVQGQRGDRIDLTGGIKGLV